MKAILKKVVYKILEISLALAAREQGLSSLKRKLSYVMPDLSDQYTSFKIDSSYLVNKVRSLHSFQISLAQNAINMLKQIDGECITIADIGDSSGSHLTYLKHLNGDNIRAISVNMDPVAIKKVRDKGIDGIQSRAELLHEHTDFKGKVNIFLSYEMIEHLLDPISFLHKMSSKSECDYFVITAPYIKKSRVGLHQVRHPVNALPFNAETTHILELSPEDWDLIFKFSGWEVVTSQRYTQYPRNIINPLNLSKYLWRKLDFDGFYGVILRKDDAVSKRYLDW